MAQIKIRQWPISINARNKTILEAALKSGIPYPHSCRTGECGNCKSRLLQGEVEHDSYFQEALSDAERESGLILACRAKPKEDIEVTWLAETHADFTISVRKFKARVIDIQSVAHNVTQLRLEPQKEPLAFAAGQYAELKFGWHPIRPYSMANRPDDPILEFHIRHVPGGKVSSYVANRVKLGDKVTIRGPFGSSYARNQFSGPIIAVAGGTGLAPMLSIIRTTLQNEKKQPIHL